MVSKFVPKVRVAHIVIKGGDYDGLELDCSLSVTFQEFIDFQQKRWGDASNLDTQMEALRWFVERVLKRWNYAPSEDADVLPITFENFCVLEPALMLEVVRQWREALTNLDTPLDLVSPDGSTSAEVSTGTVTPSRSQRRQRTRK